MRQVLCPRVIGRAYELQTIASALDAAANGHGQALFMIGEAGVGKSRLAREAEQMANARHLRTLRGRCVESSHGGSGAYRPIAEAVLSTLRREPLPADHPELRPFQPILGRLIPEWRQQGGAPVEESLVLLSEALLRLLRIMGSAPGYRGCLLVLEDLHWADAETISVMEYLTATISDEPLVILATSRPESSSAALELARSMIGQRVGAVLELTRLPRAEAEAMTGACLDGASVPDVIHNLLEVSAEGLPLLVEDLLAAWTDAGDLVRDAGAWRMRTPFNPVVPMSFAETVRRRLRQMGDEPTRVLRLAGILGRRFDWRLLPPATGLTDDRVLETLRAGVEAQLLVAPPSGFAFRHALTRDAVLAEMLPAERARQSARLLNLVEITHHGSQGEWRDLAAMLAETAGDRLKAASLLLAGGRESLASGALATAEATLERARSLVDASSEIRLDVDSTLLQALADAGKFERGVEVGNELLKAFEQRGVRPSRARIAEVHMTLASAAVAASHLADASQHLAAAERLDLDGTLEARIGALAAHVASDEHRLADAERLSQAALEAAERLGQIDVACEALLVLGRLARGVDLDRAADAFERAHRLALEHGLHVWRSRALHELGTIDMFRDASPERLLQARELALTSGALATAAWVDGELSALFNTRFDMERSLEFAQSALMAGRRYRLLGVQAMALTFIAEVHAYRVDRDAVEQTHAELNSLGIDDPFIQEVAWECRAIASLMEEDRGRAARELEHAVQIMRTHTAGAPIPTLAMWVLIRTVDEPDGDDHREELRRSWTIVNLTNRAYLLYADAIHAGHQGDHRSAADLAAEADRQVRVAPWYFQYGRRLLAEAAIRDGWGQPVDWLREAEAFFTQYHYEAVASACRSLLRRAGAAGGRPRPHRGVPQPFRDHGVTEREIEVLSILAEGLSNRQIGARLYLSPKTVEKHVASLMDKLDVRTRAQLASIATTNLGVGPAKNWGKSSM